MVSFTFLTFYWRRSPIVFLSFSFPAFCSCFLFFDLFVSHAWSALLSLVWPSIVFVCVSTTNKTRPIKGTAAASDTRLNRRSYGPITSASSLMSDSFSEVDFCELDETSGDVTPLAAGISSPPPKEKRNRPFQHQRNWHLLCVARFVSFNQTLLQVIFSFVFLFLNST